jgi:signal transduction histidine kinase
LDSTKFDVKDIIKSKISRKLTFLFVIVALVAPAIAIYYFYSISVSALPESIMAEQQVLLQTVSIMIIILIAINAGIIGFFVSRSISRPIKELYKATMQVKKGKYDVKLDIKTGDEIEELAHAFNITTATLGRLEDEREEIDNAKNEFLSITSHELRSPMTPMKAQLQMLQEGYFGKLTKKQKESLKIVVRNADRLDNIIVDFLEISRIEAARLKFDFREIDITKTIKETAKFMEAFAKEKNIKIDVKTEKLPIIEADPDRISQVLRNLMNNAIKFSPENSKIIVEAEQKKNHIQLSVMDHGIGLNPGNKIRVFEPFYQVEDASRRKHGGTGLGLAICRGIVESQKGKIWVDSKPGYGSKFYFTMPLQPIRKIEPIKVLFSEKGLIEKKIEEEFKFILGPLGISEFEELKNKNALGKEDILEYIESLTDLHILDTNKSNYFKTRIDNIYGKQKESINGNNNIPSKDRGDEVLKRNLEHF